jgi:hypothetical protein
MISLNILCHNVPQGSINRSKFRNACYGNDDDGTIVVWDRPDAVNWMEPHWEGFPGQGSADWQKVIQKSEEAMRVEILNSYLLLLNKIYY